MNGASLTVNYQSVWAFISNPTINDVLSFFLSFSLLFLFFVFLAGGGGGGGWLH